MNEVYEKNYDPSRILKADKAGMSRVQQQKQKIIAETGKKQIGKTVSAEKGETITVVVCVSACGSFVPPMLMYPRNSLNSRLLVEAPPGTIGATLPLGWSIGDLYLKWLEHSVKYSGANVDRKVLLVVDNRESHFHVASIRVMSKQWFLNDTKQKDLKQWFWGQTTQSRRTSGLVINP